MIDPRDDLIGLDGQAIEIDFGLPSPLLDPAGECLLDETDFAGRSFVEIATALIQPGVVSPGAKGSIDEIHRHFLLDLNLDFRPFPHNYSSHEFMRLVRSICVSVSKLRASGFSVGCGGGESYSLFLYDANGRILEVSKVDTPRVSSIRSLELRLGETSRELDRWCVSSL